MRVLIVSAASSIHTVRWVNGLSGRGHEVHLASVHPAGIHAIDTKVCLHLAPHPGKTRYVVNARWLHSLADRIRPDIINVHYATGYGLLGRLAKFDAPTLLSVWGSDVYDSPKNPLMRRMVRGNLAAATRIASTSRCMAKVTQELMGNDRPISITPFGVDTDALTPSDVPKDGSVVRIGTVKALYAKYGIGELIRAYSRVHDEHPATSLHIWGSGTEEESLKSLAARLVPDGSVEFAGAIPHDQVRDALVSLDVFAALSTTSESFGVAIIEAGACGLPVVVSDADGPAEVVNEGVTGFVVPTCDVLASAEALNHLVDDVDLRHRMGTAGREHVVREYSWQHSLDLMEEAYRQTIADAESRIA
ncbi:glycosyltransferase [Cutibacterium sp.]|uniref:glycosyltransferase n=1 Tax=Cutibacterium sp. TaxID=1912221 RepID=UPI0026DCC77F|nr:glycosyltransferase [Cutibacterium sp.]MDO4412651.1 glycosyltransferase [Cutibacterium sp.]